MDQRRRFMHGGPGHPYQNGPRQQDSVDHIYGQYGSPRGQGRHNMPGNYRNGDRGQSESRKQQPQMQNGSMKDKEETLTENRIFPLERPSPMFPNAKWFCRLCHQHFNQMVTALEHCINRVHARKKAALDLRKVVFAMPRAPEEKHRVALEEELMRVYDSQRMTEKNLETREEVLNEVSTYLRENLKSSTLKIEEEYLEFKLHLQGSSLSQLGLSSSDINMDLHLCQGGPADVQAKIYFEILRILEQWPVLTDFDAQLNLTIPMVKARHKSSNFPIEILFGGVAPLKTNRLLQDYASLDNRLAPLAVNFRYWAKQCSLDDPQKGFLPAHSFTIMTVFYLQQVSPPVLPCVHDSIKESEDDDYKRPEEQKDWKSENKMSVAELWLGMLRFYAAEFPVKKLCVSIRSRKKAFLAQRKWPPRFIGIEDPYCKKKSLAKCIVSDLVMPYLLMCLRSSYIYFAVPRTGENPLFDLTTQLNLDGVEDPEGDDIEDGLAADEEIQEGEEDQEPEEDQDAAPGAEATEVEEIRDLRGWNQSWPEAIQAQIKECDELRYSMESVTVLTGRSSPPVVCVSCRSAGHRVNACPESRLPDVVPVGSQAFADAQGVLGELCKYIYENFRPTISERELSARVKIVQEIEAFIQRTMPEAYLTLFGSSRNGFSLEKADLDICLKYKNKEGIDESMDVKHIIVGISRILEEHPDISDVQAIASAKVPIVKFHHDPFGVDGDISLYNVLAEHNTAMLKAYSLIDERVVHLGAAFKQYVKLCDMGDASRGSLSSYAYIVMLIHYLQKENVVPVLQALPPIGHPEGEELPKLMIDGWNAFYFEDIDRLKEVWPLLGSNKKTVGQLWLGLIDYYATEFRFDHHVVCIRQLEPLTRLEKMWTNKPLCIEDPFELDHNLGTGISAKMAKYIFSALITSRNWFLRTPERIFPNPPAIYKHFMNVRELAVGKPPKDRGCKRCGKIGHWIKACPLKQGEASDKKSNRRVCHSCGKPGHIVKDCPTRLKQIRTPKERPAPQPHQHEHHFLQQHQDNRFPMEPFTNPNQIHPSSLQNDMTNSLGISQPARSDVTSGMMPEDKTVSEDLGNNRKKQKQKKSPKKRLAQNHQSQTEQTTVTDGPNVANDNPSVRKKSKARQSLPSQQGLCSHEGTQQEKNPKQQEEKFPTQQKNEQGNHQPQEETPSFSDSETSQQTRKKRRQSIQEKIRSHAVSNQEQTAETDDATRDTGAEERASIGREFEHEKSLLEDREQKSVRFATRNSDGICKLDYEARGPKPGVSKATEVETIPFKFDFAIEGDLRDTRVENPLKARKKKNNRKKKQIKVNPQDDSQSKKLGPSDPTVPTEGNCGQNISKADGTTVLDPGTTQQTTTASQKEPSDRPSNSAEVPDNPSEISETELVPTEDLPNKCEGSASKASLGEITSYRLSDDRAEANSSPRPLQAAEDPMETTRPAVRPKKNFKAQLGNEVAGGNHGSRVENESHNPKCEPGKPQGVSKWAKKRQKQRASRVNLQADAKHSDQFPNGNILETRTDQLEERKLESLTQNGEEGVTHDELSSRDSPQELTRAQFRNGNVPASRDVVCDEVLVNESQVEEKPVECSTNDAENHGDARGKVETKPGKSQRAKKRAQRKAWRNAQKKLERAAALNLDERETHQSTAPNQNPASANQRASSTAPETLNDATLISESPIEVDVLVSYGTEGPKVPDGDVTNSEKMTEKLQRIETKVENANVL